MLDIGGLDEGFPVIVVNSLFPGNSNYLHQQKFQRVESCFFDTN